MDSIYQKLLEWTRAGGVLARTARESTLTISNKTNRDQVTSADLAVDTLLKEEISRTFPEHAILSEELAPEQTIEMLTGSLWIIDPIDGTHNYARHHYQSAVSVAYAEDGVVRYGAVYNPFLEEFFHAARGAGAFLNNKPITCSETSSLSAALVGVGRPFTSDATPQFVHDVKSILMHCFDMRRLGSGALDICWVACGRLDAFFETLNPWDIAAARLIAIEAGATACTYRKRTNCTWPDDLNGENILVATPRITTELQKILRAV
jgi:myo-inositol-1(or 4)-monophosphatase